MCFRESHGRVSQKRKKYTFSVFFFFRESHGFVFARGTVVLSRESRPCLSETKRNMFSVFFFHESHGFASTRGMVVISREARVCFSESHGRAFRKRKKNAFSIFFSRESRFCFRERHGCAFARVMAVPLGKGKTKRVFCFFFFRESHGFAYARGTVVLSRKSWPCL